MLLNMVMFKVTICDFGKMNINMTDKIEKKESSELCISHRCIHKGLGQEVVRILKDGDTYTRRIGGKNKQRVINTQHFKNTKMKILFILTLCFCINSKAQCKSDYSIYENTISVLYEKLLKDKVLSKNDTLYLILDEKVNLNKEQGKINKMISFKVPFLRLGESSPIYKMNPYLIYKKNRVIIQINICQITHEIDGMRIISSGTFVLYYRIKGVSYKLIKIENRGI